MTEKVADSSYFVSRQAQREGQLLAHFEVSNHTQSDQQTSVDCLWRSPVIQDPSERH
jgi:hypothetical protein